MSKLTRFTQKIFGSSAATDQMAEFGSFAAGAPSTFSGASITPAIVQGLSNYLIGLFGAIVGNNSPLIEDINSIFYLYAYQIAYLMQEGVAEWDAATTYYLGSFISANSYSFTVTAANATVGATYTNNSQTFTVLSTITSSTTLLCSASGAPAASGTLTKSSGTGDATITFSANTYLGANLYASLTESNLGNPVSSTANWLKAGGPNSVVTTAAAYQVLASDNLIRASGTHTVTMPNSTLVPGAKYTVKKTDSATTTTIAFLGGQSADGLTSLTLTEQYSFFQFQANGTNFDIISWG